MWHTEVCFYSYCWWCWGFWGPWVSFVMIDEFSVSITILFFCFRPILTQWFMAIFSKGCKPDNFESHNSIKLSFLNIWGLCFNSVACASFLQSNSLDIVTICETKLNVFFSELQFTPCKTEQLQQGMEFGSAIQVLPSDIRKDLSYWKLHFFMEINSYVGNKVDLTCLGVTRKRSTKRLQHTENLFRKNLQLKDVCYF